MYWFRFWYWKKKKSEVLYTTKQEEEDDEGGGGDSGWGRGRFRVWKVDDGVNLEIMEVY